MNFAETLAGLSQRIPTLIDHLATERGHEKTRSSCLSSLHLATTFLILERSYQSLWRM